MMRLQASFGPILRMLVFLQALLHCVSICLYATDANPVATFSLPEAVRYALAKHPAVRASSHQAEAAGAGVDLVSSTYLPRTDLLLSFNRATRNNVFGMIFPQAVVSPISGPVLDHNSYTSTWGSAAGALFSWEFLDFGRRRSQVDIARAGHEQAGAHLTKTRFQITLEVAVAYLSAVATQERVRIAQANVQRMQVFHDVVSALARNELRPGADESRARADLAQARIELIRAQEQAEQGRATLAEKMGLAGEQVNLVAGRLLDRPSALLLPPQPSPGHPFLQAQSAAVDLVRARQELLDRSYYPRFHFQAGFYGRGSGAQTDGTFLTGLHGLAMTRPNWGLGVSVTFPLFDFASLRAETRIETFREQAELARYDEIDQELKADAARAQAALEAARQVAENTPVQLAAARTLETQARAQYQAGLATVLDVAEAERLLTEGEIQDALARLQIWRALLAVAATQGDLSTFLQHTGGP